MKKRPSPAMTKDAWIGDAVLSLYLRGRILEQQGTVDGAKAARMSSNAALGTVAQPTFVEAQIGVAFQRGWLTEAFRWIEEQVLPALERWEAKQVRR